MNIHSYETCFGIGKKHNFTKLAHRLLPDRSKKVIIGPSEVHATSGANLGRPLFKVHWSERSACDQRSKLR